MEIGGIFFSSLFGLGWAMHVSWIKGPRVLLERKGKGKGKGCAWVDLGIQLALMGVSSDMFACAISATLRRDGMGNMANLPRRRMARKQFFFHGPNLAKKEKNKKKTPKDCHYYWEFAAASSTWRAKRDFWAIFLFSFELFWYDKCGNWTGRALNLG